MFKSTYVHRCTHIKQHVKWMRENAGLKGIITVKDTDIHVNLPVNEVEL